MLKTTSVISPANSAEVEDEEQDGKRIQIDRDEKKLV